MDADRGEQAIGPAPAFAFLLLLAPALQGVFDLKLQLAFQQAALLGFLGWLWLRPPAGGAAALLAPRFRPLWAAGALSLAALLFSPLRGWIFNEWGNFGAGLLIFACASFLNKAERALVDRAVAAGAWLLFALALLQFLFPGRLLKTPPLTNYNAMALYALLVAPFALETGRRFLAAAMTLLIFSAGSAGASLAVCAAASLWYFSERRGGRNPKLAVLLGVLALGTLLTLRADSLAGRLAWWGTAWEMFLSRPVSGFGYAAYTWAQAGFQAAGAFREHSIYAHNYFLEFLSENGAPAAAAWFWFLGRTVRARGGLVRYGLAAALLHSFVDFGLSVPANFWLFCYLAAFPAEEAAESTPRGGEKNSVLKAAFAAALLLEAALLALGARSLGFEAARARALAAAPGGRAAAEAPLAPYLSSRLFRGPALEFLGRLCEGPADSDDGYSAAAYYEMALLENRYDAYAWRALGRLYAGQGTEAAAQGLARRRAEVYR